MSGNIKKAKALKPLKSTKAPRIRGVGNPESHSQDADRHHRNEHIKSDK